MTENNTQEKTQDDNNAEKKNYKQFRNGGLAVTRFENVTEKEIEGKTQKIVWYNFNLQRSYKDKKTDEWVNTTQMREQDLLPLAELLRQAYNDTTNQ